MRTFRLLAYKLDDSKGTDMKKAFHAIDIVENIAQYLAKLYNGKTDCSSCGCVQYSDTLIIDVSEPHARLIEKEYLFISETFKSQYGISYELYSKEWFIKKYEAIPEGHFPGKTPKERILNRLRSL